MDRDLNEVYKYCIAFSHIFGCGRLIRSRQQTLNLVHLFLYTLPKFNYHVSVVPKISQKREITHHQHCAREHNLYERYVNIL